MIADYHLHTGYCPHASGTISEYIAEAKRFSFQEIGFADHAPMLFHPNKSIDPNKITMNIEALPKYVKEIEIAKKNSKNIKVKLGLEVDYFNNNLKIFKFLKNYKFDYIIGAIHFIDGWGFDQKEYIDNYKNTDIDMLFKKYYGLVEKMCRTNAYDIIAHLDLPKKFGIFPKKDISKIIIKTLKTIKKHNLTLEINTSGLFKEAKEIYPNEEIILHAFSMDIPIILGSDAHSPNEIGRGFEIGLKTVKKIGYRKLAVFNNRKRSYVCI